MPLARIPTFAIVGHPNKGKSSIVATLAQDSAVDIAATAGTTVTPRAYPMQIDGKTLYQLIDTPGFQRARAAMEWMQGKGSEAANRAAVVRQFVAEQRDNPKFSAEVQLLDPVINGAGILYVVDGSKPYGAEYDPEMEILRWSGQPSMALINKISDNDYTQDWQSPLSQYFKIVRAFNAQSASFERQVQLLTGFAVLADDWYAPLQQASSALIQQRQQRLNSAANRITDMLVAMLQLVEVSPLAPAADSDNNANITTQVYKYQQRLKTMELSARAEVEALFNYTDIDRLENPLTTLAEDLFSQRSWKLFGLNRAQLMTTAIISGAATGSLFGIGGGVTLLLGATLGAVIGAASVWYGSEQLVDTKIKGTPMGGHQLAVGLVNNPNFGWVLLSRAVTHLTHVLNRNHARRDALQVPHIENHHNAIVTAASLSTKQRQQLESIFAKARNRKMLDLKQLAQIAAVVSELAGRNRQA